MSAPDWQAYVRPDGTRERGVQVKHKRSCPTRAPGCKCRPCFRISLPSGIPGKRHYAYGATRAEARGRAADAKKDAEQRAKDRRAGSGSGGKLVSEAVAEYERDIRAGRIGTRGKVSGGDPFKPSAIRDRVGCLKVLRDGLPATGDRLALAGLGGMRVMDVRHSHVVELLAGVRERQSPSRCNRVLDAGRCLFRRLEQVDHEFRDPIRWDLVDRHRVRPRELAPFSVADTLAQLDALEERECAAYSLAALGGLRISDVLGLQAGDVDLVRQELVISGSWDEKERAKLAPKSEAGRRTVFLVNRVVRALRPLVEGKDADAYLFANPHTGKPVKSDTIRANATRQWEAALVERGMLPHEARHRAASIWNYAGVDPVTRRRLAGHASAKITDAYTHPVDEQFEANRERLESVVAKHTARPEPPPTTPGRPQLTLIRGGLAREEGPQQAGRATTDGSG